MARLANSFFGKNTFQKCFWENLVLTLLGNTRSQMTHSAAMHSDSTFMYFWRALWEQKMDLFLFLYFKLKWIPVFLATTSAICSILPWLLENVSVRFGLSKANNKLIYSIMQHSAAHLSCSFYNYCMIFSDLFVVPTDI